MISIHLSLNNYRKHWWRQVQFCIPFQCILSIVYLTKQHALIHNMYDHTDIQVYMLYAKTLVWHHHSTASEGHWNCILTQETTYIFIKQYFKLLRTMLYITHMNKYNHNLWKVWTWKQSSKHQSKSWIQSMATCHSITSRKTPKLWGNK